MMARVAAPLLAAGAVVAIASLLAPGYVRTEPATRAIFIANGLGCGVATVLVARFGIPRRWILPVALGGDLATVSILLGLRDPSQAGPLVLALSMPTLLVALFGSARAAATQVLTATVSACALLALAGDPLPELLLHTVLSLYASAGSAYIVVRLREHLEASLVNERAVSVTDALTVTSNRRGFESGAPAVVERAARIGLPVTVLIGDIDHFKRVNDTYGHAVGDEVLRTVAEAIRSCVREGDLVARLGGEEFAVLTTMRADGLPALAERIREAVAERCAAWQTTISIGGTWSYLGPDSPAAVLEAVWEIVDRADGNLFTAKRTGRDRVVVSA
jgi:diguanylate cyclase (GGDEF)-like protein